MARYETSCDRKGASKDRLLPTGLAKLGASLAQSGHSIKLSCCSTVQGGGGVTKARAREREEREAPACPVDEFLFHSGSR